MSEIQYSDVVDAMYSWIDNRGTEKQASLLARYVHQVLDRAAEIERRMDEELATMPDVGLLMTDVKPEILRHKGCAKYIRGDKGVKIAKVSD